MHPYILVLRDLAPSEPPPSVLQLTIRCGIVAGFMGCGRHIHWRQSPGWGTLGVKTLDFAHPSSPQVRWFSCSSNEGNVTFFTTVKLIWELFLSSQDPLAHARRVCSTWSRMTHLSFTATGSDTCQGTLRPSPGGADSPTEGVPRLVHDFPQFWDFLMSDCTILFRYKLLHVL